LLGGPVSGAAAATLWELTAGNPRFLRLLALEQRRAGALVQRAGVWVLTGQVAYSGEIVEVIRSWLGSFTSRQRTVLELLAFTAELPLDLMCRRGEAETVDELQELDVVEVSGLSPTMVRLKQQLVEAILRQTVQPARSRELFRSLAEDSQTVELSPVAAVQLASWSLECGVPLGRRAALEAAALANRLHDASAALRFVRSGSDVSSDPEFVVEEARALTTLGDSLAAVQTIERAQLPPSTGSLVRTRLMLARHRALRAMPEAAAAAEGVLEELRQFVQSPPAGAKADELAVVGREVVLAETEHAVFCGRFAELPAAAGEMFADRNLALRDRLCFGPALGMASALAGRTAEAVAMAEQLEGILSAPRLVPAERELVRGGICGIYLAAGMWNRCEQLLGDDMVLFGAGPGVSGGLAAGLLHTLCGRAEKGLDALQGTIAQLGVADPAGVLPLGLAAAAYASALGDDPVQAQQYLHAYAQSRQTGCWAVRAGSDYFRIAAESRLNRRAEAIAELNERAGQAAAKGLYALIPLYLGTAARLGDLPSARRLAGGVGAMQKRQDPAASPAAGAEPLHWAGRLLRACEAARHEGNNLLAYELAGIIPDLVDNDTVRHRARSIQREAFRKLDRYRSTRQRIEELSDFERNLALAAGKGRSSASLAKELHLSPRTVDWHLGKIYSRLRVSGRTELCEVLV
jgi:DNA-binding CsgD family transcriptional regulator